MSGVPEEDAASCKSGYPQSATHSILFLPPTLPSLPWVVVSEYRASLQRRMHPSQEDGAFQSPPPPPGAGGKGVLLDCTPAPTPTEVSAPHHQSRACCGQVLGPSCYKLVHTPQLLGWPVCSSCFFPGLVSSEVLNNNTYNTNNSHSVLC